MKKISTNKFNDDSQYYSESTVDSLYILVIGMIENEVKAMQSTHHDPVATHVKQARVR